MTGTWVCWHLHVGAMGADLMDSVLLDGVVPVLAELPVSKWFFVRYWQGGPHLRLRMRDLPEGQTNSLQLVAVGLAA